MPIKVDIRGFDSVRASLDNLRSDLQDKATSAALNKVGAKAQTEMTRAITDEYNIQRSEVVARMRLSRASRGDLVVVLDPFASGTRGRALNMIHFLEKKVTLAEARRRARSGKLYAAGVGGRQMPLLYFKVKKGEAAKPIPGAFLGNKGRTVFIREGKSRLPIKPLSTIGIPQMFSTRRIQARVMARIDKEIQVEFNRAIKMVLERYR